MTDQALKLMIPGPVQPAEDVMAAVAGPVQPHYGAGFVRLYADTTALLKTIFHTSGDVLIMNGSGTAGIDACLGSAFSGGEKILVGVNGFFGDRLVQIAEGYGLVVVPVAAPMGEALRATDFETAFQQHPDAMGAAVVHLETSTTVVNPIHEIGPVVRAHNAYYFVDAVSSLGGLTVNMDAWNIDLCASASQKCLGALPGLSPVAVGPRGWQAIDRNPHKGHGWYGDLRVWRKYAEEWGDWHPCPITMAVSLIHGLHTSLQDLLAEGMEVRLDRYRRMALRLRDGLRRIGLPPFTSDDDLAPVLTAAYVPAGVRSSDVVAFLSTQKHIKISGGLGDELKEKIIRIGHMSPTVSEADIDEVLAALAESIQNISMIGYL